MEEIYPMRINKYLAFKKISTRRGADELIKNKKVFINGKLAVLGSKVNENDKIEVRGVQLKKYIYLAYNKPIDIITHSPQSGEKDIRENIKNANIPKDIFPIGRLDKNSHGLIILTNDGRLTDQLLNPKFSHEKEYVVQTSNKLRSSFKAKMEKGVNIEGYITKPCKVKIINNFTFNIILTEGKKHQIRRMCSALFQEIADLKRIRIMNIQLGNLKPNNTREIKGGELEVFLGSLGLTK
ncbi:23S rRNA pseudouridine synthase F [Candidatus Nomurabacteria bacterium CG10_big_fil_rev_8_21_14_0_10_35_16]|uniref:Pseudouridine synthase n=1 Tax=Candidatus Nomurabacteria bacterium CG10_big_fil_rev_8_21_14_0_10_35_16 TaxID=1974731 RepID=A0A2H0TDB5_9BACT|nr:MAG: 23S rRNA pseudouridine synthase F [Candidatus Nomurabacteria bacterium CG10_big_fil_rev_8_21_14_0_10_35_16]